MLSESSPRAGAPHLLWRSCRALRIGRHPDVVETEARYHSALESVEAIHRKEDTLVLSGDGAELVFAFVPPPPTRELTDVRWELQSLQSKGGPDATVSSAHPAHLYSTATAA